MRVQRFILLFVFMHLGAQCIQSKTLLQKNSPLESVFKETVAQDLPNSLINAFRPDVSFLYADLKYRDGALKICEFGEGKSASRTNSTVSYRGSDYSIASPYWALFWEYCARLGLPVWFVGSAFTNQNIEDKRMFGWSEFVALGGRHFETIRQLEQDVQFQTRSKKTAIKTLRDFQGIVIYRYRDHRRINRLKEFQAFQQKYPNIFFLNQVSKSYASNKHNLAELIDDIGLQQYRPAWKTYKKEYTPKLAQTIKQDLGCTQVVIKPINSGRSNGIIMVHGDKLDRVLKDLFGKKTNQCKRNNVQLNHCPGHSQTYAYWAKDKNNVFIAESLEESKPLTYQGKLYDPTMRVVFILAHDQGKLSLTFLGGYWETPCAALHDKTSLTKKHKSVAEDEGSVAGIKINEHDFSGVKKMMSDFLFPLYAAMLDRHGRV